MRSTTPSRSSIRSALGASWIPAPISPNSWACSSTQTGMPCRESARAVARPPMPPPTTSVSTRSGAVPIVAFTARRWYLRRRCLPVALTAGDLGAMVQTIAAPRRTRTRRRLRFARPSRPSSGAHDPTASRQAAGDQRRGGTRVLTVGRGPRLRLAAELGSDAVVDYQRDDPVAALRAATAGRGVDCVFECSGNPATVSQALAGVRRGGTVALLGLTGGAKVELEVDRLALDEIDLLGIRSSPNAYPAMIDLLATGAVTAKPLATHVYPLARVHEAFTALERREAIRPILTM